VKNGILIKSLTRGSRPKHIARLLDIHQHSKKNPRSPL
jgi:hypothetical protein